MGALERLQQLGLASGLSQKEVNPDVTPRRSQGSSSAPLNHTYTNITTPPGGLGAVDSSGVLNALQEKADIQRKLATDPRLRSLNSRMALASAMRGEDAFQKYAVQPRLAAADADIEIAQRKKLMEATKGLDPQMAYILSKDPGAFKDLLKQQRSVGIEAQKELNKAGAANLKLSDKQKDLMSSGLEPGSPEYLEAVLGDNSLDFQTKKALMLASIDEDKNKIKFEREIDKLVAEKDLDLSNQKDIKKLEYALKNSFGAFGTEVEKETYKDTLKNYQKTAESNAGVIDNAATILDLVDKFGEDTNFGWFAELISKGQENLAEFVPGMSTEKSRAVVQALAKYNNFILPIAKTLGANPSNYDARIIGESFGGKLGKSAILAQTSLIQAEKMIDEEDRKAFLAEKDPVKANKLQQELQNTKADRRAKLVVQLLDKLKLPEAKEIRDRIAERIGQPVSQEDQQGLNNIFDDEINALIDQYS